jgi:hypothetical protein
VVTLKIVDQSEQRQLSKLIADFLVTFTALGFQTVERAIVPLFCRALWSGTGQ